MKNILKTVLPVIAIFSAFSLHNTYATNEEDAMNTEMDNAVDVINQRIEKMKQISEALRNYVDGNQYNNMNLQSITDNLQEIRNVTSPLWFLKGAINDLQNYYGRNLDEGALRLLQQYIGEYFEIVNLLKQIL